jgi:rsbT co-antagonist protein RsbR
VRLTQKAIVLAIMTLGSLAATLIATYYLVVVGNPTIAGIVFAIGLVGWPLTYAYWRGWEAARYVATTGCIAANLAAPLVSDLPLSMGMFIAPVIILILAGPYWMIANSLVLVVIGLVRGVTTFQQPIEIAYYTTTIIGLLIIRLMVSIALRDAQESAAAADEARQMAEQRLHENEQQAERLRQQNEEQQQLLSLVDTLETPTVSLGDGIILMPIVGVLDTRRAQLLTARLLKIVYTQEVQIVILDLTGLPLIDTAVTTLIMQTVQSLRLLGCKVAVTGISAQIALTLTQLGVTFGEVLLARSPQEIIAQQKALLEPAY